MCSSLLCNFCIAQPVSLRLYRISTEKKEREFKPQQGATLVSQFPPELLYTILQLRSFTVSNTNRFAVPKFGFAVSRLCLVWFHGFAFLFFSLSHSRKLLTICCSQIGSLQHFPNNAFCFTRHGLQNTFARHLFNITMSLHPQHQFHTSQPRFCRAVLGESVSILISLHTALFLCSHFRGHKRK